MGPAASLPSVAATDPVTPTNPLAAHLRRAHYFLGGPGSSSALVGRRGFGCVPRGTGGAQGSPGWLNSLRTQPRTRSSGAVPAAPQAGTSRAADTPSAAPAPPAPPTQPSRRPTREANSSAVNAARRPAQAAVASFAGLLSQPQDRSSRWNANARDSGCHLTRATSLTNFWRRVCDVRSPGRGGAEVVTKNRALTLHGWPRGSFPRAGSHPARSQFTSSCAGTGKSQTEHPGLSPYDAVVVTILPEWHR